ncbi:translocation/assembly module TamB domain-containing protein [Galbibacter mesophilus]|uniref:translocation/assembly module TamB domain-containing protein n=1 Tax=Galbibacter mesophilus TaxID=379069 RepID=UPI00191EB2DF|nr:translocation/assembly module TamB [Galbibacter mesophilus]MCM5663562.1 translocation/assembly module TamB domain-containing protein [Galbibacter mesophilus]
MPKKQYFIKSRFVRILLKILASLLLLFVILVLLIRSPWGQNIIVGKAVDYLSNKIGTEVAIDKLYLTFSGNLSAEGIYIEDQKGDTLVYSKRLEAFVALLPLIRGNEININYIDWEGLKATVTRDTLGKFNFDYIVDAFAAADTTQVDTTSGSMKFNLEKIKLQDIRLIYDDKITGIDLETQLGEIYTNIDVFDLDSLRFEVDYFDFNDGIINYTQRKPFKEEVDTTTSSTLPTLRLEDVNFNNVQANYSVVEDQLSLELSLDELVINLPNLDLQSQEIELDKFELNNSSIVYRSEQEPMQSATDSLQPKTPTKFSWPDWKLNVGEIAMENNEVIYQAGTSFENNTEFNPNNIQLKQLNLFLNDFQYAPEVAKGTLKELSFIENGNFQLSELHFELDVNDNQLSLADFRAETGRSRLAGDASMQFSSVETFINNFEKTVLNVNLPRVQFNIKDAFYFQKALSENVYLDSLAQQNISGSLALAGSLDSLRIDKTNLNWGKTTRLELLGSVTSAADTDSIYFYVDTLKMNTLRKDMLKFVNEDSLGISLPDSIKLSGSLTGDFAQIKTKALLETSQGTVRLNGTYSDVNQIAFNANLGVERLQLGKILKNDKIGSLSFRIKTSGKGNSINTLNAQLTSQFDSLVYSGYDFSSLKLNGKVQNGQGDVKLIFKDDNLDIAMDTKMVLDSVKSRFNVLLNVKGADLYKLGITNSDVRTGFKLQADYLGDLSNFQLDGNIKDGVVVFKNQSYNVGNFDFFTSIEEENTEIKINSIMLDANLKANSNPSVLAKALENQFYRYWKDTTFVDSNAVKSLAYTQMDVKIKLRKTPALSEVYFPKIEEMDSLSVVLNFNEQQQTINADVFVPFLQYSGSRIDSLYLDINGSEKIVDFDFGWRGINSDPIAIGKTNLTGILRNKNLELSFKSVDEEQTIAEINSEMIFKKDTIEYSINPNRLVLNKRNWSIPASNKIRYAKKYVSVQNFDLTNGDQKFSILKSENADGVAKVGANFENFKLSTFLSILNPQEPLVKGTMKGNLNIEDPFGNAGLQADLAITNLQVVQVPLGTLSLDASSENYSDYTFDLALKEGNIDLDLTGNYIAKQEGAQLDLDLAINDLKMKALEGFVPEQISNTKGSITGSAKLTGTTTDPVYEGNLNFENVEMLVNQLNSTFFINDESLSFNNDSFNFESFIIKDKDGNDFALEGEILTENLINPTFDLGLKANNFQILNSTAEDNELFYGKVSLNTDITITGNLEIPKITGDIAINEGSTFTVVVPESQLDINEREGVVLFVNRSNENSILTRREELQPSTQVLENFDIETKVSIGKKSVFKIIINERTGDNLQVAGTGNFDFKMEPNGRTTLSGMYEVNEGHYEASLYNIVNRKFTISEGSTIVWNGDPLDAALDIQAIYNVETSAGPLMVSQVGSQNQDLNSYRNKYPFMVYLNIDGELLSPELSFQLDMPEDEQGAAGGEIFGYVQQLNSQEEELNKQVFSLLVLNRFFPASGSDGSAGGPASIARDNISDVLSGQLNAFSDKLLGDTGIQLDFGLDSYTDPSTASNRTELDINATKSLFNDRLVVQVGSEVDVQGSSQNSTGNAPVIGNVGLEYLITEDGRYRLRGYRKNKFEGVVDGEIIVTGLSLIFNKEFNKFKDLWKRQVQEEIEKSKEDEKEQPSEEENKTAKNNKESVKEEEAEEELEKQP